jgi:hypothetical protein
MGITDVIIVRSYCEYIVLIIFVDFG